MRKQVNFAEFSAKVLEALQAGLDDTKQKLSAEAERQIRMLSNDDKSISVDQTEKGTLISGSAGVNELERNQQLGNAFRTAFNNMRDKGYVRRIINRKK